jgi:hypothetical protein
MAVVRFDVHAREWMWRESPIQDGSPPGGPTMENATMTAVHSPLERFFLERLTRFARLVETADSSEVSQWQRLARRATLSAYQDCVKIGLEAEAQQVLAADVSAFRPDEEALSA